MESSDIRKTNKPLAYAMALLAVVIWSSAFPASRYALEYYGPMSLMLMRFISASATLAVIGYFKKIRLPRKQDILKFLAGGFVGVFLYMFFFNLGAVTVVAGVGSFIVASAPVYTLILSRIILKETVKPLCWVGVGVSFCGLIIIMVSQLTEFAFNIGIILILGSALSTGGHNIIQRNFLKNYTALEATTYTIIGATIFMLVFIPGMIRELPGNPTHVNLIVLYLGVIPAALGYLCWGFALSKAEKTTHVAVFLYLIPFAASLLAYLWLDETFPLLTFLGGVVIIAGMFVSNFLGVHDKG
ncbi:MAG: DMT family transporter [Oscillospiraceae bacterium]|nr:DMT family transporter [Oscillospiraceae bacterium]